MLFFFVRPFLGLLLLILLVLFSSLVVVLLLVFVALDCLTLSRLFGRDRLYR